MNHRNKQPGCDVKALAPPARRPPLSALWCALLALSVAVPAPLQAQTTSAAQTQSTTQNAPFKDEELDQMLAPIALYPDSLLAQVLMASTYPGDFQEAVTWSKAHPDEKGDAAIAKVDSQPWEASVKSLVAFPQVLAMMGAKPEHVQRLGDAFLADPARVMDRVQALRRRAQEAGNLTTNEHQKVSTQTEANKQVIVIEPAQPQTVYVPAYQPSVYGAWSYPAYPPYYYPPPPYYYPPGGAFISGMFWGAAIVGIANGLWGGCNWGGGNVNINVNKFNNVNVNNRINNGDFNHNAGRRGDVPYRDSKSQQQFGQKQRDGAQDREAYRGKDGRDAQRERASNTLSDRGADPAAGREKLQGSDRGRAEAAARDTGRDTGRDPGRDAGRDAGRDSGRDAGRDAGRDSGRSSGGADRAGGGGDRGLSSSGGGASQRSSMGSSSGALSGVQNSSASRANADRGQASRSSMSSGGGGGRAGGGGGGGRAGGGGRR